MATETAKDNITYQKYQEKQQKERGTRRRRGRRNGKQQLLVPGLNPTPLGSAWARTEIPSGAELLPTGK
eukprot:5956294-Amphidinium_carterae.1